MKLHHFLFVLTCLAYSCGSNKTSKDRRNNKKFANTTWYSQELGFSWEPRIINNIVLKFSTDSVEFNLPGGDGLLASELLNEGGPLTPSHFTASYSSNDTEIIFTPEFTGDDIHLQLSGDSLIWKGGRPVAWDYVSLKKTPPIKRLK